MSRLASLLADLSPSGVATPPRIGLVEPGCGPREMAWRIRAVAERRAERSQP